MKRKLINIFMLTAGVLLLLASAAAQQFDFVSIDVPCSSAPPSNCPNGVARRTALGGITPGGDMAGNYTDGVGKIHAFLLSGAEFRPTAVSNVLALSGGQFTSIDVPVSLLYPGASGTLPTTGRGTGISGEVVGSFVAPYNPPASTTAPVDSAQYCPAIGSTACIKGFVYSHGKYSAITFPGHPGAVLSTIGPDGTLYGCLHDYDTMDSMFSAAWSRFGDTSIAAGGGELSDPNQSYPNSMHGGATPDGKIMVGFWTDMTGHTHGYKLENGVLQLYDVGNIATNVWDITPAGELIGLFVDSSGKRHGFIDAQDGSGPHTVDAPITFNAVGTSLQGVNPSGALVGQYTDTSSHTHGLLAIPTTSN